MSSEQGTFIKVNDHMDEHPKIEGLSDKAFRSLFRVWFWCSRTRSDGIVTPAAWKARAPGKIGRELIEAGLAHPREDGGVEMHDYLKHQRSREHIEALSAKRSAAGQRGGRPPKAEATRKQKASAVPSNEEPNRNPEDRAGTTYLPDRGQTAGSPSGGGVGEEASRKRSAEPKGHRLPDDWWPTEEDRAWFRDKCPDLEGRGTSLTEEFRDYWHSRAGKEARKIDWSKTWRNRMREKQDRAHNQKAPRDVPLARPSASHSAGVTAQSLLRTPRQSPPDSQPQLRLASGGL
jgi:hypothetical protein